MTVGSKFEVKGEDVTAVITAENKDIFWASDLCFDLMSLLYFKSVSEDDSSVSVSPCCCIAVSLLCDAEDQTSVLQMVQNYVAA